MTKTITPNPLSFSSIFVEPIFGDSALAIASGFIWKDQEAHYLVTNWHVVTGLHPQTRQPIADTGATPDRLRIWLHTREKLGLWKPYDSSLYDNQGRPLWREHKTHRSAVDVAILPLTPPDHLRLYPLNAISFDEFRLEVSQDVFIVGFPRGITGAGRFPIWKRGSIASEPDVDVDGLPKLLIDAATREGMSGAPVIAQYVGVYKEDPGAEAPFDWIGQGRKLLGVYSGRLPGEGLFEAQLGIVWKASILPDLIASGLRPE